MEEVIVLSFASFPQTVNILCKFMSRDIKAASEYNSPETLRPFTKIAEVFRSKELEN